MKIYLGFICLMVIGCQPEQSSDSSISTRSILSKADIIAVNGTPDIEVRMTDLYRTIESQLNDGAERVMRNVYRTYLKHTGGLEHFTAWATDECFLACTIYMYDWYIPSQHTANVPGMRRKPSVYYSRYWLVSEDGSVLFSGLLQRWPTPAPANI